MALRDLALNISVTGADQAAQRMQRVEGAMDSMGRKAQSATQQMETSWQRMSGSMNSVNSLLATFGVGFSAVLIVRGINDAINAIDDLKVSTIQIAAIITTMQGPKNVAEHYAQASIYAEALAKKLQEVDAKSFANYDTLLKMVNAMTQQGVLLDINNKKEVDAFTSLSNAVAMYTTGQNQSIQANQEIRSLMSGQAQQGAQLALQIDSMAKSSGLYKGGLKEIVDLGKKHGDTLERLSPFLVGINAASGDIEKTWVAIKSSAETAKNMIQRVAFSDIYKNAVKMGGEFITTLKENADGIGKTIKLLMETMATAAKIAAVYFAVFVAAPAVLTAATLALQRLQMAMMSVQIQMASASIVGRAWALVVGTETVAASLAAASALGKLKIAGSVVFAFFAGWEIGKLLYDQFDIVKEFSITLVANILKLVANVKYAYLELVAVGKGAWDWMHGKGYTGDAAVLKLKQEKAAAIAYIDDYAAEQFAKIYQKGSAAGSPKKPDVKPPSDDPAALEPDHYGERLRKNHAEYLSYLAERDKRIIAAEQNTTDLLINELKHRKDLQLITERAFQEQELQLKIAQAERVKTQEDRQYQEALDREAKINAVLKRQKDGTFAEGKLPDGSVVGVDQYNSAIKATETARIQKEAAAAKLAAMKQDLTMMPQINRLNDEKAAKEIEIQKMEALGYSAAAEAARNQIKYDKMLAEGKDPLLLKMEKELDIIKRQKAVTDELRSIKNTTEDIRISMIDDPNKQALAQIEANYAREKQLIEERIAQLKASNDSEVSQITARQQLIEEGIRREFELRGGAEWKAYQEREKALDNDKWNTLVNNAKHGTALIGALGAQLSALTAKYEKDKKTNTVDSYKSQLNMASQYTGLAGELFMTLADTQDQTSRQGFETAKAFNIAATIMSTATAIMNAMANAPWPLSIAAAAVAAATGAVQLAAIESTSFGGGASAPSAPSGSFAAGGASGAGSMSGVGSATGAPITSTQDQQLGRQLDAIATTMGNAALAMGRSADSLYIIADTFKTGVSNMIMKASPGSSTALDTEGMSGMMQGALIGSIVPFLGTVIGGIIGGIVDDIFGGDWQKTGAGFTLGLQNGKLDTKQYLTEHKSGGLFSGDENRTTYTATDPMFSAAMGKEVNSLIASLRRNAVAIGAWNVLGPDTGKMFDSFLNTVKLTSIHIETAGRKEEDIIKDVQAAFGTMSNVIVEGTIPSSIKQYAIAVSETASDVLNRLGSAIRNVNADFALIGKTLISSSMSGANYAYKLQELMGGADAFAESMKTYYSGMFTDSQRAAMEAAQATRLVSVAFMEMQRAIPKTRTEFISLVNSLDVTTTTGASTFAALMDVSGAFATMTDAADKAAKALSQTFLDTALNAANTLKELLQGPLSTLTPQQQYFQQRAAFNTAVETGNNAAIPELSKTFLESSRAMFASGSRYNADYAQVTSVLSGLAGIEGPLSLDSVTRQIAAINGVQSAIEAGTVSMVSSLAELRAAILQVTYPAAAITSTISTLPATPPTNIAVPATTAPAAVTPTQSAWEQAVAALYDPALDKNKNGIIDLGELTTEYVTKLLAAHEYQRSNGTLPSYAVGTSFVTHDQTAQIHQGEMIVDKQSSEILRKYGVPVTGSADGKNVEAAIKEGTKSMVVSIAELRAEIAALRKQAADSSAATVAATKAGAETVSDAVVGVSNAAVRY